MPKEKSRLKEDLVRFYRMQEDPKKRNRLLTLWRSPGVYAVITYRFGNWLYRKNKWIYYLLTPVNYYLQHRIRMKWGIRIAEGADIGGGFVVIHEGGVFIPWDLVAGKNLTIHHDVTMGYTYGLRKGIPTIGDNVTIAPGVKIFGKIRIGNNVKIGPNVVITRNVPDNSVVQSGEARIFRFTSDENSTSSQDDVPVYEKSTKSDQ